MTTHGKVKVTNPRGSTEALEEAVVQGMEGVPIIDTAFRLRVRTYIDEGVLDRVEEGEKPTIQTDTNVSTAIYADVLTGAYVEIEDATLLIRDREGTPILRHAIVNGFLTQTWVVSDEDDEVADENQE